MPRLIAPHLRDSGKETAFAPLPAQPRRGFLREHRELSLTTPHPRVSAVMTGSEASKQVPGSGNYKGLPFYPLSFQDA
jgi:hypothetical protein